MIWGTRATEEFISPDEIDSLCSLDVFGMEVSSLTVKDCLHVRTGLQNMPKIGTRTLQ